MTTHSSVLALEIPWTEEPGGLQGITKESDPAQRLSTHMADNNFMRKFLLEKLILETRQLKMIAFEEM